MSVATLTRPWRSLRPRSRAAVACLAVMAAIGGWYALWSLYDPWPARATLKTPFDTWPLGFSPDRRTILTSGEGGISRWDVATGAREGQAWAIPGGESAFVGTFSPDGRTLAAVSAAKGGTITIQLFETSTGRVVRSLPLTFRTCWGLRFADQGRSLRAFLGDLTKPKEPMTAITWDVGSGEERSHRTLAAPILNTIPAISDDGRTLAIGPVNKLAVELWDLDADRSLGSVMNPNSTSVVCWGGVGLTADGKTLAVSRDDGTLEFWDVARNVLRSTHAVGRRLTGIKFSPDGRTIAADVHFLRGTMTIAQLARMVRQMVGNVGQEYGEVMVVDVATGRPLARSVDAMHPLFSPDGRTIATRQLDLSLKLRDAPRPR